MSQNQANHILSVEHLSMRFGGIVTSESDSSLPAVQQDLD